MPGYCLCILAEIDPCISCFPRVKTVANNTNLISQTRVASIFLHFKRKPRVGHYASSNLENISAV